MRSMAKTIEVDRRVRRSKETVLKHALELLTTEGVAGLSIDEVSARSGVAKTTIYRHWPSRSALILDACSTMGGFVVPDTGTFRGDLVAFAREVRSQFQSRNGAILPSIMDAAERDEEMAELFAAIVQKIVGEFQLFIDRGVRRKEIRRGMDARELATSIIGPLVFRRLFLRSNSTDAVLKKIIDRAID